MNRSLRSVEVYLLLLPLFVATFEGVVPVQGASGPIFTVSMSPSTQNAYQGQTITYTVTVMQTYSCVVTLQAQSSGTIPTPSMTPSSAEGNFTSIFTLQIPQTTSPGTYGLGVVATIASSPSGSNCPSGDVGEVAGGSATVVVQAAAFTITPTPSTLTASQGGTASISISVDPVGTFNQPVTISASVPSVTCNGGSCFGSPTPSPTFGIPPFTSTLSLSVNSLTPPGQYQIAIVGQSCSGGAGSNCQTVSATVTVTVGSAGFSLSVSGSPITIPVGQSGVVLVSVASIGGFSRHVTLQAPAAPTGITASLGPTQGVPPFTAGLTVSVAATVNPGTYSISITGQDDEGGVSGTTAQVIVPAVGFSLVPGAAPNPVPIGSIASFTVQVLPVGGSSAPVTITATAPPGSGVSTLNPQPSEGVPPFTTTIMVAPQVGSQPGTFAVTVTGTSEGQSTGVSVTIQTVASDFSVSASPTTLTLAPDTSGTATVSVSTSNSFQQVVTLSATGAPAGITATLNQLQGVPSYTSTLTVFVGNSVSMGSYQITIIGTSGSLTHQATLTVVVSADFSITVTPSTVSATQGSQASVSISVTSIGGWSDSVTLSVNAPANITTSLSPTTEMPTFTSSLLLGIPLNQEAGQYVVTVTGTNALRGVAHQATILLTVTASGYSLTANPSATTIPQGGTATLSISVTPSGGFSQSVGLSVNVPAAFIASIGPTNGVPPFTATVSVQVGMNVNPALYFVTVYGSGGRRVEQAVVQVTVTQSTIAVSALPNPLSIHQNTPTTATVTVTAIGAFSSNVALATTTPAGFTATFAPSSGTPTLTSTLTLLAALSVNDGTYAIVITGTGGNRTASTTLMVNVGSPNPLTIAVTPSSGSIYQSQTLTFQVKVNSTGTLSVPVSLTTEYSPLTATVNPSSGSTNMTATLVVTAPATISPGTYVVVVQATAEGVTVQAAVTLTVQSSGFTVNVTPSSQTMYQSDSATFTVTVGVVGTFNEEINLTALAPSDLTASVAPYIGTAPYTSTLLVTSSLTSNLGPHLVIVEGVAGGLTVQAAITITVQPSTFTLTANPTSATIYQTQSTSFTVTVNPDGSFNSAVFLSVVTPSGITGTAMPSSATPPFTATVTLTTTLSSPTGGQTIVVTGSGGGKSVSTSFSLTVNLAGFSLSVSPSSATIYQTQSSSATVSVAQNPYFTGTVALSESVTSTNSTGGLSAAISPTSGTVPYSATISISTTSSTGEGTYTVTVTGSASGVSNTVSFTIIVQEEPPSYSVTVKTQGLTSGDTNIYVDGVAQGTQINDASGSVTVGPFNGLTAHIISVDADVSISSTEEFQTTASSETVTQATTLTFTYNQYYSITWDSDPTFPSGQTVVLLVDSNSYTETTPFSFTTWQEANSGMTFSVSSPLTLTLSGRTYTFSKFEDSAGNTITSPYTVSASETITAIWARTAFMVMVDDVAGANVTFNAQTQIVGSSGSVTFWTAPGSYTLSTSTAVGSGGIAEVFQSWTVPAGSNNTNTANPTTITVGENDIQISITRTQQVQLTITSQYPAQGAGWYNKGAVASFTANPYLLPGKPGERMACTSYSGDISGSGCNGQITMDNPHTIQLTWSLQYQLTINSQVGAATGAGWYDPESTAQFAVTIPTQSDTQYTLLGWSGDYQGAGAAGQVVMDGPKTITANWQISYLTGLSFTDANNQTLATLPASIQLTGPSGSKTTIQSSSYPNLYLQQGTWTMTSVNYHGVDVLAVPVTLSVQQSGNFTIGLEVYTVQVNVASLLFGAAGGATVYATVPDGFQITATADPTGVATLSQLPTGNYQITAKSALTSTSTTVTVNGNQEVNMRLTTPTDIAALAGIVTVIGAALYLFNKRRGTSATKARPAKKTEPLEEKNEVPEGLQPSPSNDESQDDQIRL